MFVTFHSEFPSHSLTPCLESMEVPSQVLTGIHGLYPRDGINNQEPPAPGSLSISDPWAGAFGEAVSVG